MSAPALDLDYYRARLVITGRLQNESGIIHVMAEEIAALPTLVLPDQASHDYH